MSQAYNNSLRAQSQQDGPEQLPQPIVAEPELVALAIFPKGDDEDNKTGNDDEDSEDEDLEDDKEPEMDLEELDQMNKDDIDSCSWYCLDSSKVGCRDGHKVRWFCDRGGEVS